MINVPQRTDKSARRDPRRRMVFASTTPSANCPVTPPVRLTRSRHARTACLLHVGKVVAIVNDEVSFQSQLDRRGLVDSRTRKERRRIMAEDLTVTRELVIPGSELRERFSRSSGPGGQHVNTTDSRVELSFDVANSPTVPEWLRTRMLDRLATRLVNGVLTIAASEQRAQLQNRAAARERLASLLRDAAAAPPPVRRATKPSRGAKERRIAAKKRRGITKRNRRASPDD
ncbi:alternative ribosome rescue aminoacyl-tRNA hydrolase ArfB [Nocardia sp. NPDC046473]|uniref:alternative ribosome rescue aminoacyl-tRNA hydrolase ArfB n=1 Tax=Nocardia sp. NPDC046473 TaxID=3155733 RepID=UPI0033FCF605